MQFYKKKWFVLTIILFVVFLVLIYFANSIISTYVDKKVRTQINKNHSHNINIDFDKIRVNVFSGSVKLFNLIVQSNDSALIDFQIDSIQKPFLAEIKKLKVSGLKIFHYVRKNEVLISSILIQGANFHYADHSTKKELDKEEKSFFQNLISDNFKGVNINSIEVKDLKFTYYRSLIQKKPDFEIDSINIDVTKLALNSQTIKNSIPVSIQQISMQTGNINLLELDEYSISSSGIDFNLLDSTLIIHHFSLNPKLSKKEFNKKHKYNTDWYTFKTKNISFYNVQLSSLIANKTLNLDLLEIKEPDILIYRDKRLPEKPYNYKPLIAGLIKKIPFKLKVDTLIMTNGKLTYEEQSKKSDIPGVVFFNPLYITANNITNLQIAIQENPSLDLTFRGKIMGASFLDANLIFNLSSDNEYFTARGTLDEITAAKFNTVLQNLTDINIEKGVFHKIEFNITANDNVSNGNLSLQYENLNLNIQNSKKGKTSKIKSWVANGVINKNNLKSEQDYKEGFIYFERKKDKGLANYIWNSCKTGIISVIAPIADDNKKQRRKRRNK